MECSECNLGGGVLFIDRLKCYTTTVKFTITLIFRLTVSCLGPISIKSFAGSPVFRFVWRTL